MDVWAAGAVKPDPKRCMVNGNGFTVGRVNRGDLDSNRAWGVWNDSGLLVLLRRDQLLGDASWTGNVLHVVVTEFPKTPDGAFYSSVHVVERFDAFPTRTGQGTPHGHARSTTIAIPSGIPVDALRKLADGLFWLHLNSGAGEYAGAIVKDDAGALRLVGPGLIDGGMGGFYAEPIVFRDEGAGGEPRWFATAYSDATLYESDGGPATATFGKIVVVDLAAGSVVRVDVDVTFPEGWSDDDASDWLLENGGPTDLAWKDGSLAFDVAGAPQTVAWPIDIRTKTVSITQD